MDPNLVTSCCDPNNPNSVMVTYDPKPQKIKKVWEDAIKLPTMGSMEVLMSHLGHAQMVSEIISQNHLSILENYVK